MAMALNLYSAGRVTAEAMATRVHNYTQQFQGIYQLKLNSFLSHLRKCTGL